MKISLTSKHLKTGDLIIRTKPKLNTQGQVTNSCYLTEPVQVIEKQAFHTIVTNGNYTFILDHFTWNDGEWTRFTSKFSKNEQRNISSKED